MTVRDFIIDGIIDFVKENRKFCFTYKQFMKFYFRKVRERRYPYIFWHTIERTIRRLAEERLLVRLDKGKFVVFCVTDSLLVLRDLRKEEILLGVV